MGGKKAETHLSNNYRYIEAYAGKANLSPWTACQKILVDAEKILKKILGIDREANSIVDSG